MDDSQLEKALDFVKDENEKYATRYGKEMDRIIGWCWKAFAVLLAVGGALLTFFQMSTVDSAREQLKQHVTDQLKTFITPDALKASLDSYVLMMAPAEFQGALDRAVANALKERESQLREMMRQEIAANVKDLQRQRTEFGALAKESEELVREMAAKRCGLEGGEAAVAPPCYRDFLERWRSLRWRISANINALKARLGPGALSRTEALDRALTDVDDAFEGKKVVTLLGVPIGLIGRLVDELNRAVDLVR